MVYIIQIIERLQSDNNNSHIGWLLPKAIVIYMSVMMAMRGAHTLVASPAEARMNSCDASSQAGNTTS